MRWKYLPAGCFVTAIVLGFNGWHTPKSAEDDTIRGVLWRGNPGITESVARIMERQSRRAAERTEGEPASERSEIIKKRREVNSASPAVSRWPVPESSGSSLPQLSSPWTIGVNFTAVTSAEALHHPPDSIGAVGPTQILVTVKGRIKVFDKTGAPGPLDADLTLFFGSVGDGTDLFDPQVIYDRLSERFYVTALTDLVPGEVVIAVSSGPTITSSTSFTFFDFRQDLVSPPGDPNLWADYDSLGVDRFSLYIGVDMIENFGPYVSNTGYVVNKADLLAGILTVTAFRDMWPGGNHAGPDDPRGVSNDDPSATEGYFVGPDVTRYGRLVFRRVTYPGGVPTLSGNIFLTVPTTNESIAVPQLDAPDSWALDAIGDPLFTARIFTNKITGVRSLWTAHNIQVNQSGVADDTGGMNGSRWYQIGNLSTNPTLLQSGTLFDTNNESRSFWIPTIAMSGQGHAALGCSTGGWPFHADAAVTGRLSGDAAGTLRSPVLVTSSSANYHHRSLAPQRWGDYSQTVVDPNDDMTFWTFQEYCDAQDSWAVQVVQLKAPPPAAPSTIAPSSVCMDIPSVQVTVNGAIVSGSGFFDPGPDFGGPGFASHISASITGGVSVAGVVFDSPTQVTLNLSTQGASSGAQDVTITNPDGQSSTGTGLLTILTAPHPTAASNAPVCVEGTLQLFASTVAGGTYSWTGPNGFTSSQQNPVIPSVTGAASGAYVLRVTSGGCTSAPVTTMAMVIPGGSACSDGNACTIGEVCLSGACQGGNAPDADGDGHLDGLCGGSDCNDSNPGVWSSPAEVTNLNVMGEDPSEVTWNSQGSLVGPETIYELASGSLSAGTGIDFSTGACMASGTGLSFDDTRSVPPSGGGFWYLTRAHNSCGIGTYGTVPRDAGIPPCP